MASTLCNQCSAACCRYLALPLDKPTCARDYDDIRWYLMHDGVIVFVEEGDWYIQLPTGCRNLAEDNRCTVYRTRPRICREYKPGECDYIPGDYGYDHLFSHPKQIEAYYRKRTGKSLVAASTLKARRRAGLSLKRKTA